MMGRWVVFEADGRPGTISGLEMPGAEWVEVDHKTLETMRRVDGVWIPREPVPVVDAEPPEPDPAAIEEARKIEGIAFEGVMCSATSADQAGLMAVLTAIQLQGAGFKPTRFEFENGSRLVIHLGNYQAFIAAWLPFRQSFFIA